MEQQVQIGKPALPDSQGPNGAPLQPLLEAARRVDKPAESSSFTKAMQELFKHHLNLQKRSRDAMITAGYENAMFMEGKQLIRPNTFKPGQWIPYTPKRPGTIEQNTLNFFRFYTSNSLWKWQLSNPDIVATPGVGTEAAREGAAAGDIVIENHERRYYNPVTTIQEGMGGLCWGTYAWQVNYNPDVTSVSTIIPIFQDVPVVGGEGFGQCGSCPFQGPAAAFQQVQADPFSPPMDLCPHCGQPALVEQPPQAMIPSVVGQREVKLGQLEAELLQFPECHWDFAHRLEDSSWFIHMRETSVKAVRRLLGNIKLPNNGEGLDDFGLRVMKSLAWAAPTPGMESARRDSNADPATIVKYSLGPDDYAHIILSKPEETVDGQTLPAGPLINTYPNGMTLWAFNGMSLIASVEATHHSRITTSGFWHAKPGSGTGQGLDDLKVVQKRFNINDSQVESFFRASSTPAMLMLKEAIGDTDPGYLGTGNINIPIIAQNLPEGMKPEDVVRPAFQPQNVPAQFFSYIYQHLNNFAQITSHITDFSGGLPGVKNSTATGAQITQANSNALFTPPLQVKADVRLRIAYITLDLYREYFPVERPFPLKGRHGRLQYKYLSAANLSTDIQLEVVKDSELPKNLFTKREDYFAFLQMLGGAAGLQTMRELDPEFCLELERAFNVNLKSEAYDHVASLCQQRLVQLEPFIQLVPDPVALTGLTPDPMGQLIQIGPGVLTPPIALEEPEHDLQAKWLSEWLVDDEGLSADPILRACVIAWIRYHFQLDGQQKGEIAFQMGAVQGAATMAGGMGEAMGGAAANEINPVPDVQGDVPDVNNPGKKATGRPKPKGRK